MTEITWRYFKNYLPKDRSTIVVEDHEGNRATGIWRINQGFENVNEFPIGKIVRWSPIRVVMYQSGINYCRIFYENGEELKMEDIYEDLQI